MRTWPLVIFLVLSPGALNASGQTGPVEQRVTLFSYMKYRDTSRASFSFERGVRGAPASPADADNFDIIYGNLKIGRDADWFTIYFQSHHRSRVVDVGKKRWADVRRTPSLPPSRPQPLDPEKALPGMVDASAGVKKHAPYDQFVRIRPGHIYLMHVKSRRKDFYVLFRVEELNPGDSCTISWKAVPPPERDIER